MPSQGADVSLPTTLAVVSRPSCRGDLFRVSFIFSGITKNDRLSERVLQEDADR